MRKETNLANLIEALKLALAYENLERPFHCEHDVLYLMLDPADVSEPDLRRFESYGFSKSDDGPYFESFNYGSA